GIPNQLVEPLLLARYAEQFLKISLGRSQPEGLLLAHPRLAVRLGRINHHVELQRVAIDAMVTLLERHIFAHRITEMIEPRPFVETERLYDECIAVPLADRVAHP